MRLHPRETVVKTAHLDLMARFLDWRRAHDDLTQAELLSIFGDILGNQVTGIAKYLIRAERHPDDPNKPGGVE